MIVSSIHIARQWARWWKACGHRQMMTVSYWNRASYCSRRCISPFVLERARLARKVSKILSRRAMSRRFHMMVLMAAMAFAASVVMTFSSSAILAQAQGRQTQPPAARPTAQGGPPQPAPAAEVSPVTPRGPIVLTARPPRIATPQPAASTQDVKGQYVGSLACQRCHAAMFERWSHTRMANVVTDPKANPSVVVGDFSKPNPLVTFRLEDVAFVYGTKWKQRYFLRRGDDYYPAAAQWDVINRVWRPYFVQPNTDWWVAHYPAPPGD